MRAVLDPNVLISALISPAGTPGGLVDAWASEQFELVVSPALLGELRDVLSRPKFRRWVTEQAAAKYVAAFGSGASVVDDPQRPLHLSPDPDDDYLIALARVAEADYLVSGDRHLTALIDPEPLVLTPAQFMAHIDHG